MRTYVALLRGINVGGHAQVAMADLRNLLVHCGFMDPRSLLQSGNLVFQAKTASAAQIERVLETEANSSLGLRTDFFIRPADEWSSVIRGNPFIKEAERDPSHLVVMFLKDSPSNDSMDALRAAISGPELVQLGDRYLYITYPEGIGRSRLTNARIEQKLGLRGTGRNWNTILRIDALTRSIP